MASRGIPPPPENGQTEARTGEPALPSAGGSAAARVYAHVKERLLDGVFPPGALLSENELAQRLGLSRTPVRQAFVQLEVEGLLELYPKRGALVVPLAASEVEDVFEARMLVEEHCIRRAAGAGAALETELRDAITDQERALRAGGTGFAEADRRFHRAIVAAAGNAILTRLYDALRDRQRRIAAVAVARGGAASAERFVKDHRDILAAIERRDGDEACRLVAAHLRTAREVARDARSA